MVTRPLLRCYVRSYLGQKYCRSSQRAQHEIQEQSSNTEEQTTSNTERHTSMTRVHYKADLTLSRFIND